MDYTPVAGTPFLRVTSRKERSSLPGREAYFALGGRYNRPHQRTVYAAEDALVAVTEAAYDQAMH